MREMIKQGLENFEGLPVAIHVFTPNSFHKSRQHLLGSRHVSTVCALVQSGHDASGRLYFEGMILTHLFSGGGLCSEKVDYVRNFVFREIDLDRVNPAMPYHDLAGPFVNHWFSSCMGGNANSFCGLNAAGLSPRRTARNDYSRDGTRLDGTAWAFDKMALLACRGFQQSRDLGL